MITQVLQNRATQLSSQLSSTQNPFTPDVELFLLETYTMLKQQAFQGLQQQSRLYQYIYPGSTGNLTLPTMTASTDFSSIASTAQQLGQQLAASPFSVLGTNSVNFTNVPFVLNASNVVGFLDEVSGNGTLGFMLPTSAPWFTNLTYAVLQSVSVTANGATASNGTNRVQYQLLHSGYVEKVRSPETQCSTRQ